MQKGTRVIYKKKLLSTGGIHEQDHVQQVLILLLKKLSALLFNL